MNDPEQPRPQTTPMSLGREQYDDEQAKQAKNSRSILESHQTLTLDDENKSGKRAEESSGHHFQSHGAGNRRGGLLGRITRGLNGRASMRDGGESAKGVSKTTTLRSSSPIPAKSRNVNQQGVPKGLRNEALHPTVDGLGIRSSRTGDEPCNDVGKFGFLLDSSETDESSNCLDGLDGEEMPSKAAASSIEGRWVDDSQELEQPKETFPSKSSSDGFTANRRGKVLSKNGTGARPTLRRTMSTPSLQSQQPGLRSILKKGDHLSSTQPRERSDLSVQFDIVEMREFNRIVGDNPSVSRGVPIALGWNYNPTPIIKSIDEYELFREPRRSKNDLALPPTRRADILNVEWGVPIRELQQTIAETNHIRCQRWQTANQDPIQQRRDELFETAKRRFGRAFHGGKKKELEQLKVLGVRDVTLKPMAVTHDDEIHWVKD